MRIFRSPYAAIVRTTAEVVFGRRRAAAWLRARNSRLGGVAPLALASDRQGAERVLAEIDRIGGPPRR